MQKPIEDNIHPLEGFGLGPIALSRYPKKFPYNLPAYKFLHSKDLHFWTKEKTIKIDTLFSFADMESKGGVGDPLELIVKGKTIRIENPLLPENKFAKDNLYALGLADLRAGGNITFSDYSMERVSRYAYCMSSSVSKDLFQKWQEIEGYDAIIKIKDIIFFVMAIAYQDYHNKNLLGGRAIFDWVEYVDMPIDISVVDLTQYKFLKDRKQFKWQDEMRMTWPKVLPKNEPPYFLHIPNLDELIEIVKVPKDWHLKDAPIPLK